MRINYLSIDDIKLLKSIVSDAQDKESNFLVYKKNASEIQENVKFPEEYRELFNKFIFKTLQIDNECNKLSQIHSNCVFMV